MILVEDLITGSLDDILHQDLYRLLIFIRIYTDFTFWDLDFKLLTADLARDARQSFH